MPLSGALYNLGVDRGKEWLAIQLLLNWGQAQCPLPDSELVAEKCTQAPSNSKN